METTGPLGKGSATTGVFAKQPLRGAVKTRMAPFLEPLLGESGSPDLALAMLRDAAVRLSKPDLGFEIVFAPAGARPWFHQALPGHSLRAQRGPELGARMANWFSEVLGAEASEGVYCKTAVAVGADSPWTSAARVREAHELLAKGADVVLGPDTGGGYYLVGMREARAGLFTEITMSTKDMFEATCDWVRLQGLRLELLETDYDLDEPSDWQRLEADLSAPRKVDSEEDWPVHLARFAERVCAAQRLAEKQVGKQS